MTLHPRLGIDELAFGCPLSDVTSRLGQPSETRVLKEGHSSLSKIHHYEQYDISFGTDSHDALAWIVVGSRATDIELWGGYPFRIRATPEQDFHTSFKRWLESQAKKGVPEQTCFGATISVPSDRVVFCFSDNEDSLESIQLESPLHPINA
jgi:hypothetical protein